MTTEILTPQAAAERYGTTKLYLSSGNGPVYRTVLKSPPRDASASEIPIIDVSGILETDDDDDDDDSSGPAGSPGSSSEEHRRRQVAREIRHAAENTGFFYIKNHGVSKEVTQAAYHAALEFFRQPLDVKNRASSSENKSRFFNGYKPPRTQRLNPTESVDHREGFSWQYDPRFDPELEFDLPRGHLVGDDHDDENDAAMKMLQGKIPAEVMEHICMEDFLWDATSHLPTFKSSVVEYWKQCLRLARALVRVFALSLDLPEDYFAGKVTYPDANLSLNYYQPLEGRLRERQSGDDGGDAQRQDRKIEEEEEAQTSIGSHTDFQFFTILWQDSSGGLQVLNRDGQWINARPVEDTLVINIADYFQRITNDRYVSTVHRARNTSGKERISIPFFFGFNLNESCGVIESCVAPGEVKKYGEISCVEWVRRRAEMMHFILNGDGDGAAEGAKCADGR